jgi:hypothetical protein
MPEIDTKHEERVEALAVILETVRRQRDYKQDAETARSDALGALDLWKASEHKCDYAIDCAIQGARAILSSPILQQIIAGERDACARIAMAHGWDEEFGQDAAWNIVDAIRARSGDSAGVNERFLTSAEQKTMTSALRNSTTTVHKASSSGRAVGEGWQPPATLPEKGEGDRFDVYLAFDNGDVKLANWFFYTETCSEYHASTGVYLGQSLQGGDAGYMTDDGFDVHHEDDGKWRTYRHPDGDTKVPMRVVGWMEALRPAPPPPVLSGDCDGSGTITEQDFYSDGSPARSVSSRPCPGCQNCKAADIDASGPRDTAAALRAQEKG